MTDASPETINFEDFTKVDLRVARVLEARPHPNADKLLVLQEPEGAFWDFHISGYTRAYGTAFAAMALQRALPTEPKPESAPAR